MYQSKIEAAPFNLFDAQTYVVGLSPKGVGARLASNEETTAYMRWQADKSGLTHFPSLELQWMAAHNKRGQICRGATFGRDMGRGQYEAGAYSIPMPGANQQDIVTMETLNEAGDVIASQTLPVEPKKRGIIWDKAAVQKAVGPVAKPAKARKARAVTPIPVQTSEGVIGEMDAHAVPQPVADASGLAQQVEAMARQMVAMQSTIDTLLLYALEQPPIGEMNTIMDAPAAIMDENMDATPIAVLTPWKGAKALHQARADHDAERLAADRARRVRIVRAYLRMRSERDTARQQRGAWHAKATMWRERAGEGFALRDQVSAENEALEGELIAARREVARLKAIPHHMGNVVKLDDVQRLTRERDEARASLASTTEEAARLRKSVEQGADMLDQMVERALRAEIALKAVEGRAERGSTPYRINGAAVTFAVAA